MQRLYSLLQLWAAEDAFSGEGPSDLAVCSLQNPFVDLDSRIQAKIDKYRSTGGGGVEVIEFSVQDSRDTRFWKKIFKFACNEALPTFKRFYKDQLPGGKHFNPDEKTTQILKRILAVNRPAESAFGQRAHVTSRNPGIGQVTASALVGACANQQTNRISGPVCGPGRREGLAVRVLCPPGGP